MKLCKLCNQRPAVVFVSKTDGNHTINEGYCLPCAIKSGITPIGQLAEQFGMPPQELEGMMHDFTEMMDNGDMREMFDNLFGGEGNLMELPDDGEYPIKGEKIPLNDKKARQNIHNEKKKKKCLSNYGVNLTEKARQSLLDKVIGREQEIDRAVQILNRRSKNNPVLLGLPGVGKTAIAEGIAQRIAGGDVPEKLVDAQVWLLDLTAVVAGTQYRGQFESRLKSIVEEAKTGNTILVIDEIHSIVSAGDADGAMNAANILKPALSKGEIQIIGATTLDEYRKYVEKDAALERRFQPVIIDEPSREDTIRILQGVKEYYELYHNVTIDDALICEVVDLSGKYITDRYQPDKSIDVIDEAASRLNMKSPYAKRIIQLREQLAEVSAQIEALEEETEETPSYEAFAKLKSEYCRIDGEMQGLRAQQRQTKLTLDDVAQVIELWTGIPVKNITETDKEKLLQLEARLHQRLVGQDAAVQAVARAVRRNRALKRSKKRPVSFIFVGPTGVGKTELVKSLAESLFDDEKALIRMDMSEYMEKHSVSKIIGAPPGYVGYDEAGQLTEKVRRKPYSVILLDEIEKAHEDVFNILLQILDDGRITDSQGRVVNFENTILIMTSNAGTSVGANSMGFLESAGGGSGNLSSKIDRTLKEIFRPEFLNRIDEIVEFHPLTKAELMQIIDLMLKDLKAELAHMNVEFAITDRAKENMLERAYQPKYGARPLRREIQTSIEDEVSTLLLAGDLCAGQTVSVEAAAGGAISVKVK